MDIRSFFKPKAGANNGAAQKASTASPLNNSKKRKTISSDSSPEAPINNNNNHNQKVKGPTKKVIDYESDDDDFVPSTPPVHNKKTNNISAINNNNIKGSKKKNKIIDSDSENEDSAPKSKKVKAEPTAMTVVSKNEKEKKPIVSADHFFGKTAPKAEDPIVKTKPVVKEKGQEKDAEKGKDRLEREANKIGENGTSHSKAKQSEKDLPNKEKKLKVDPRVEALKSSSSSSLPQKSEVDDFDDDDDFENSISQLDESIHEAEKKGGVENGNAPLVAIAKVEEKVEKKKRDDYKNEAEKITDVKHSIKEVEKHKNEPSEKRVKEEKKETNHAESSANPDLDSSVLNDSGFPNTLTANYRNYKNREGPRNPGSKEIPEGAPNCLEGLTFVITGVLESLERTEAQSIIERYGGKVTQSVSKRTSYAVIGREAGPSKVAKVKELNVKTLDEDGLLELISKQPGKRSKFEVAAKEMIKSEEKAAAAAAAVAAAAAAKKRKVEEEDAAATSKAAKATKTVVEKSEGSKASTTTATSSAAAKPDTKPSTIIPFNPNAETELWVDKYKPKNLKQIIGQQGEGSNVNKLKHWLLNWHKWHVGPNALPVRATGGRGGPKDDGRGLRAALLSGPPGVGKTTTATLVCQELGFTFVELNASDQRSQKSLKEVVAEALNNHTVVDFVAGVNRKSSSTGGQKHCLIMDEVDGMAGNEDRGGMNELIQLIKKTQIPIITMCNDRQSQKVRSLANYALDLRFYKPRVDQIKGAIMSICFKEGIKIQPPTLNNIIAMANQDVRQVIHNLSMWTADCKELTYEKAEAAAEKAKKNLKIGPFEVIRKVFETTEETRKMSLIDKSDLFFHDYSLSPLFVQENYATIVPNVARGSRAKHMRCLSRAASSIAAGDLIDRKIRSHQNWSLLPTQAVFASVIPGEIMRGNWTSQCAFPSWLGKHSKGGKANRQLQELKGHMRLNVSGSTTDLMLDYMTPLASALTKPLVHKEAEGVAEVIKVLDDYDLLKDDMDAILELNSWPGRHDPMAAVASKTKAALTRTYNKESHLTPYANEISVKKSKKSSKVDLEYEGGPLGDDEHGADDESDNEAEAVPVAAKAKKPAGGKEGASGGAKGKGGKNATGTQAKGKGKKGK